MIFGQTLGWIPVRKGKLVERESRKTELGMRHVELGRCIGAIGFRRRRGALHDRSSESIMRSTACHRVGFKRPYKCRDVSTRIMIAEFRPLQGPFSNI